MFRVSQVVTERVVGSPEPGASRTGQSASSPGPLPATQNGAARRPRPPAPTPPPALGDRLTPLLRWPAGLSRPATRPCPESQATE